MLHAYKTETLTKCLRNYWKRYFLGLQKSDFPRFLVDEVSACIAEVCLLLLFFCTELLFMSQSCHRKEHPHLIADFIECFVFPCKSWSAPRFDIKKLPQEQCVISICHCNCRSTSVKSEMWMLNTRYNLKYFCFLRKLRLYTKINDKISKTKKYLLIHAIHTLALKCQSHLVRYCFHPSGHLYYDKIEKTVF